MLATAAKVLGTAPQLRLPSPGFGSAKQSRRKLPLEPPSRIFRYARRSRQAKPSPSPGGCRICHGIGEGGILDPTKRYRVHRYARVRVLSPAIVHEVTPVSRASCFPKSRNGSPHPNHKDGGPFFGAFGIRADPQENLESPIPNSEEARDSVHDDPDALQDIVICEIEWNTDWAVAFQKELSKMSIESQVGIRVVSASGDEFKIACRSSLPQLYPMPEQRSFPLRVLRACNASTCDVTRSSRSVSQNRSKSSIEVYL